MSDAISGKSALTGGRRPHTTLCALAAALACLAGAAISAARAEDPTATGTRLSDPFVVVQLPADCPAGQDPWPAAGTLPAPYGNGARLVVVEPDGTVRPLLDEPFDGACDPDVSFDGRRVLFAGKRRASDCWNIFEVGVDGSGLRQVTRDVGDCRSPCYQSTLYTITSPMPWYQITFVGNAAGTMNEDGSTVATHLYSCRLDGSAVRRLSYNLSSDVDPFLMSDGRLALASWQRSTLGRGTRGRMRLFGINLDGADDALLADPRGRRVQHMPCVTTGGLLVFVEADEVPWDGAGQLAAVSFRRPLHSYRQLTRPEMGLFHSPSPLPDGGLLVSRRPADGSDTHAVYRFDPASGKLARIFDDPRRHDVQARLIRPRTVPDGRSSVVTERDPHGKLYCLNVYLSDLEDRRQLPEGSVRRLRVLEGVPLRADQRDAYLPPTGSPAARRQGSTVHGLPPLVPRRILGEIDVSADGSFQLEVPANIIFPLQTLDADGMALRRCGWIWAKNHEPRGCIGCHEDGEATPENVFVEALEHPAIPLCLPASRRRSVDFRRDVMPIIQRKCVGCHGPDQAPPRLDGGLALVEHAGGGAWFDRAYESLLAVEDGDPATFRGKYVDPGSARTSPLIWHVFGRNTSRPWDGAAATRPARPIPRGGANSVEPLSEDERRALIEWIDLGAMWDGPAAADPAARTDNVWRRRK